MRSVVFPTSKSVSPLRAAGSLLITVRPDVPELVLATSDGQPCVLRGEDMGKLTAWLTEEGYRLPR
jgi:hypothetical protein